MKKRRELHIVEVSIEGAFWRVLGWCVWYGFSVIEHGCKSFMLRNPYGDEVYVDGRDDTAVIMLKNYHAAEALADKIESIARGDKKGGEA